MAQISACPKAHWGPRHFNALPWLKFVSGICLIHPFVQVDKLQVPTKYMAQISACPKAQQTDKGHVDAIFTELPKEVTAALLKK